MLSEQNQEKMYPATTPVFVVGTGRCGSTLVSNILRNHPSILSLSEFFSFITDFATLVPQAFPAGSIESSHFWRIISNTYHKQNLMLRAGIAMDEVLYPCSSTSRFQAKNGVPAILQTTLPHLTSEHDAVFDEVREFVLAQPAAEIQDHYKHLFEWLQQRFQRRTWIERSGSSIRLIEHLHQCFPDARFVHIIRDGRNCAISMSKHYGFRMATLSARLTEIMGYDPFEDGNRSGVEKVPAELSPFLPEHFDPDAFRHYTVPPSVYGRYWSEEVIRGLKVLAQLPGEQVLTLRYEDLLTAFVPTATKLITFIDPSLADNWLHRVWLNQVTKLIHAPNSSWEKLPKREQTFLQIACNPGFQALQISQ
jgi:hypothetical protein